MSSTIQPFEIYKEIEFVCTYGVMVILRSKMAHFLYSPDDRQKSVIVSAKYLNVFERTYLILSENAMNCWVLS